jgi:hypothetical protein
MGTFTDQAARTTITERTATSRGTRWMKAMQQAGSLRGCRGSGDGAQPAGRGRYETTQTKRHKMKRRRIIDRSLPLRELTYPVVHSTIILLILTQSRLSGWRVQAEQADDGSSSVRRRGSFSKLRASRAVRLNAAAGAGRTAWSLRRAAASCGIAPPRD